MEQLHIAIDGRLWGAFWTGTSSYLRGISRALVSCEPAARYILIAGPNAGAQPRIDSPNVEEVAFDPPHLMDEIWEQITLPTYLGSRGVEMLLAPGSVIPLARDFKAVPVVHDLGFLHHPEFYDAHLRDYLTKWVEISCRTAEAVVCNSDFTRRSVMESYGLPSDECETVYPAPGPEFSPEGQENERDRLARVYGLDRSYVLAVCSGARNKNLDRALQAMSRVFEKSKRFDHQFAVVGMPADLPREAQQGRVAERVRVLGRVGTEDLAALYRCADLFVFPSLYEGFGLPPVEAMACGCPVVASDRSSLPEALGDAAQLCDPLDREQMGDVIMNILDDPQVRKEMARKGLQWRSRFSWERSAKRLVELLHRVWGEK